MECWSTGVLGFKCITPGSSTQSVLQGVFFDGLTVLNGLNDLNRSVKRD